MELIADILLVAGAIGAAVYCFVLGRRLNKFNDLEKGVGGAVAVLSAQVEDLRKTLSAAQVAATASADTLTGLTARAEAMSRKLELQMASLHDIPEHPTEQTSENDTVTPATHTEPEATLEDPVPGTGEPIFMRHRRTG